MHRGKGSTLFATSGYFLETLGRILGRGAPGRGGLLGGREGRGGGGPAHIPQLVGSFAGSFHKSHVNFPGKSSPAGPNI